MKNVNLGAREQGRNHLERRIFRGRADKGNVPGLDVWQKRVLLCLVEAVHLVDEDDGALPGTCFAFGIRHHFLDLLDAGEHRAEGNKVRAREPRNQPRQRGLTAARRSPEKHGAEIVIFNLRAQRLAGSKKFFLADDFVERARAHALRERLMRERHFRLDGLRQFGEKAHLFAVLRRSTAAPEGHWDNSGSRCQRAVLLASIFHFLDETSTTRCWPDLPCIKSPASAGLFRKLPRCQRKTSFHTTGDHTASSTRWL